MHCFAQMKIQVMTVLLLLFFLIVCELQVKCCGLCVCTTINFRAARGDQQQQHEGGDQRETVLQ